MRIFPVTGLPEIREGDDLAALVTDRVTLEDGDVLVVAQKAVSKAEGRVVRLDDIEPSERALELAGEGRGPSPHRRRSSARRSRSCGSARRC